MLHRRAGRRQTRGVVLLEYALSLPLLLLAIFVTIDIGRIVMVSTALHEAVTVGARAGARTGFVGGVPSQTCPTSGTQGSGNTSYEAFCQVAAGIPGAVVSGIAISSPTTGVGGNYYCKNNAGAGNLYVTVTATVTDLRLLTPGLSSVLGGFSDWSLPGELGAVGTARCEVARA